MKNVILKKWVLLLAFLFVGWGAIAQRKMLFLIVLLFAAFGFKALARNGNEVSNKRQNATNQALTPLAQVLNSDGTINQNSNAIGSFDVNGYQMTYAANGAPVFELKGGITGDENWSDPFPGPSGANNVVYAIAKDASNNIYIGGSFTVVCGVAANYIAKWNGLAWSALGKGMNAPVFALAIDGSGNVYAGGGFTTAGGFSAKYITKWNGSVWSALGTGLNGEVGALAIDGSGNVYAGGSFTTAGGVAAKYIAKWDGSAWSAFGTGMNNYVYTLAIDGSGNVYAGGGFTTAGGVAAKYIAKWNGSVWSSLGTGMNNFVSALAIDGSGNVYAGGGFTTADGVAAKSIAKWNGSVWSALGTGLNGDVGALAIDGSGNVYAGGYFTSAGGVAANYIAKWDGTAWSAFGTGMNQVVYALTIDGSGDVYAGGNFLSASGVAASRIAKWNGSAWSAIGKGMNNYINALAIDGSGNVYAGGKFTTAGGVAANYIAKWNGSVWSALGTGMNASVLALAIDGSGNVYAGGGFTTAGGVSANKIAKWNGSVWSSLETGMDNTVEALAIDGTGNVYAAGAFTTAGEVSAIRIAKWDGSVWSALGTGMNNYVHALAIDGTGNVYAGGGFTTVGGVSANRIAKWNGSIWSALGTGMNSDVYALAIDGSGNVFAGGGFTNVGGVSNTAFIAKWNGSAWSSLGTGMSSHVLSLAIDGSGNVYAGGVFTEADGVPANQIAKWNGSAWSNLGSGTDGILTAIKTYNNLVYCGGYFLFAGGKNSAYFGKYTEPITFLYWDGSESRDWSNAANWSGNTVPTATDNVVIPDVANDPIVNLTAASPAICKDLTLQAGAILTIPAGKALAVTGTLTNNADIAGLVVQSTSDASDGTGSLINSTAGVLGTVERYVSGDYWHLISPAATAGETVVSFVGMTQNDNRVARNGNNYALAPWLEGTGKWDYYKVAGSNSGLFGSPAQGFQVLRAFGTGTGKGNNGDNGKLTFKGTLAGAGQNIAVTKSGYGWNLIGNPYPCALDVSAFIAANTGLLDPSYQYIYVSNISDVTAYGYVPNTAGLKLAPGEGFFIRTVTGGGKVSFTTDMKSSISAAFKAVTIDNPTIQLTVEDGNGKLGTTVQYVGGATKGLDPGKDAGLFNGTASSFSLFTRLVEDNGVNFTIQALPDNNLESMVVPVGLVAAKGATVTFSATAANLPVNYKVYLEDKVTGAFTQLDGSNSSYTVSLEAASNGTGRFYLHTNEIVSAVDNALLVEFKVVPIPEQHLVRIIGNFELPARAMVYDMNGKLVATSALTAQIENAIALNNCNTGVYLLKVESGKGVETKKFSWKRK